jgi:Zn-dependent peptidase ImmA (M78 family)
VPQFTAQEHTRLSKHIQTEEEVAREYRKRLGVDHLLWLDPMTILMKLRDEFGIDFKTVPAGEIAPAAAKWDFKKKLIKITNETFAAANFPRSEGHARFSIFHEVIHALRGDEGEFNRLHSRFEIASYATKLRAVESRTDKITAAFMAPRHLIREGWGAREIASSFGISLESARIRIEQIWGPSRPARKLPESVAELLRNLNKKSRG